MQNRLQQNWQDVRVLGRLVVARFIYDRCLQVAANLTFTTLLSIVPLITIALTMFAAFPVFEHFSAQIKDYMEANMMPASTSEVIAKYMQQFTESATRLTAVGIVFLVITAMSMMLTIDNAFNLIWRVARPRALFKKLVVYWAVLTLAPLLIGASLSLSSWLVGLSMGYVQHIPFVGVAVLKLLPILFTTLAFTLLFQLVPNRYVPFSHALIGAVLASVLFGSMNAMFALYIKNFPTYTLVYGAFATIPIFLMWIYLSWITILLGAVVAASLSYWRKPPARHLPPVVQMLDALRLLKIMSDGLIIGKETTFPMLSNTLGLGYDQLEIILERLQAADMVCKTEQQGWILMRDPSHIRAAELLKVFVLDHHSLIEDAESEPDPLQSWLVGCVEQLERHTDITLQALFELQAETKTAE
ncbi:MAG: YihY family inner membrane protein [Gallionella sp.]|nr:YihY family inner membrane protein [Gallionella sp.]MDD4958935.1 YihY family inner membrane protein [Gallionella sp.]